MQRVMNSFLPRSLSYEQALPKGSAKIILRQPLASMVPILCTSESRSAARVPESKLVNAWEQNVVDRAS